MAKMKTNDLLSYGLIRECKEHTPDADGACTKCEKQLIETCGQCDGTDFVTRTGTIYYHKIKPTECADIFTPVTSDYEVDTETYCAHCKAYYPQELELGDL